MSVPLSTAGLAVIAENDVRVIKKMEIIAELWNGDLRQSMDVTDLVTQWGLLTGDSTVRQVKYEMPTLTFEVSNKDGLFSPDGADSVWTDFGIIPKDGYVKLTLSIRLPTGALEVFHTYYGRITNAQAHDDPGSDSVEIETRHVVADQLDAKITKWSAGDELQVLGSSW